MNDHSTIAKTIYNCSFAFVFMSFVFTPSAFSQIEFDVESGAVFMGYNDVRIPGDAGTLFSLSEELEADTEFFYRFRLFYALGERHNLGLLYAPLSLRSSGQLDRPLVFEGETFSANIPLESTWRFNSYRLIYRYDFLNRERIEAGIGLTAKIRDAEINVRGGGLESKKTNVGFVPIVHFRFWWHPVNRLGILIDGDALAAPQGRAEDILASLTVALSERIDLKLGYRLLEGGADNDEVYNFAWINYAAAGLIVSL